MPQSRRAVPFRICFGNGSGVSFLPVVSVSTSHFLCGTTAAAIFTQ